MDRLWYEIIIPFFLKKKKTGYNYILLSRDLLEIGSRSHPLSYLFEEGVNGNLVYLGNAEKNLIEPCKSFEGETFFVAQVQAIL